MLEYQNYNLATSMLLLYAPDDVEPEIEWNDKASSIAMYNRAMLQQKPLEANRVTQYPLPKAKRKGDSLVPTRFSATYCLSTDGARYTRAVTAHQKQQERMIRDMEKLRHIHETKGKHDVTFTTFSKDITDNKGAVVRIENWATLTITRNA